MDSIQDRISQGELRPGDRLESEEVLAAQLGASRQTVHKAIQELKRRGIVERKRRWGTTIAEPPTAPSSTALIALLFDYATDYPQGELVRGVTSSLGDGQRIVLADSAGDYEAEALELMRCRAEVSAIIAYPLADSRNTHLYQEIVDESREGGPPLVFIDRTLEGVEADSVVSDNLESVKQAMSWTHSRGSQRIAFFSGDNTQTTTIQERHKGYRECCEAAGTYDPTLERWFPKAWENQADRLLTATEDALGALLRSPDPITALFCTQDVYAVAAAEALSRLGVAPGSLDLITFNDWPPAVFPRAVEFARIVQPVHTIGQTAVEVLTRRLSDRTAPPQAIRLASRFLTPSSSAMRGWASHKTNEGSPHEANRP